MATLREQILEKHAVLKEDRVNIPEWGGEFVVREMNGAELFAFQQSSLGEATDSIHARLAVYCVRDEDGERVFSDADVPALEQGSGGALHRVFTAAAPLCGLTKEDVEELEKASPDSEM